MSGNIGLKLYETNTVSQKQAFTGIDVVPFYIISGSRLLTSFLIDSIDLGATVQIEVENTFNQDSATWDNLATFTANSPGLIKRVFSDFHSAFRFRVTVSGGSASYKIGVTAYDNAIATKIENATIDVNLNHTLDSEGRFDSVRIGDGVDLLEVNPGGSINVALVEAGDENSVIKFNDVLAVPIDTPTVLLTYTVPPMITAFLNRVTVSGDNTAKYQVRLNGDLIGSKRTYFGAPLNEVFEFWTSIKRGHKLQPGDVVEVSVEHSRPDPADFEASVQVLEKG